MKRLMRFFYAGMIAIASCAFFSSSAMAQIPAADITIQIPAIPDLGPNSSFSRIAQITAFLNDPRNGNYATTLQDGQRIGIEWTGGDPHYLSVYSVSVANGSVGVSAELVPPTSVATIYYVGAGSVHTCGSGSSVTWEGYWQGYSVTVAGVTTSGSEFVVTGVHYTVGLCGNNV